MTFSIIIAAYNVAPYIKKAIDSCINQIEIDENEYEIIVIDDGSKDDTGKIIDEYNHITNMHIVHQQNKGLSGTRNYGVTISKGDFIIYLDGDDWLLPNTLSSLRRNTANADLIVFPMTYWYSQGNQIVSSYGLDENTIYSSYEFISKTIGRQKLNIIPAPCKCYKKSVLIENKQKFIEGILHEDNPYFADTIKNFHKIIYINEGYYMYRQHRVGSITNNHTIQNFIGVIDGNKHILKTWQCSNKYINYMVSSINIFQVILKYEQIEDTHIVINHYRRIKERWTALKQILNFPFIPKAIIRHLLFLIDPWILMKITSLYYKKTAK